MDKQTLSIPDTLLKSPTGITGLDEITGGCLPSGRPTLVCGSAGCGKTMLGMEFLVRGATQFGEPGVFMMIEENAKELTDNVRSLGFDLDELVGQKKIVLDHVLRNVEFNGERNRLIYVLKSRGMAHSNQVREFLMSDAGIDLRPVYLGGDRVLTGTAQETQERAAAELRQEDHARKLRQLAAKRKAIDAQIAALQAEGEAEEAEVNFAIAQETLQTKTTQQNTDAMSHLRGGPKGDNSQAKGKP